MAEDAAADAPILLKRQIYATMIAAAALYGTFVWRASAVISGKRTFVLFDDSMISMRYAYNLAHGHGLVWNVGGPAVEGYTNFGWTLWMAVIQVTGIPSRYSGLAVALTSLVLLLLCIWYSARLAGVLAPEARHAPVMAAMLTATSYSLAFWSLRGMEVGVIAAVVVITSTLIVEHIHNEQTSTRDLGKIGFLLGLGSLVRPDVAILALVAVPMVVLNAPKARWTTALVVAGPFVAVQLSMTMFREAYFGALLPNTYTLKIHGFPLESRLERGARALAKLSFQTGIGLFLAVSLVSALRRPTNKAYVFCLAVVGVFFAYMAYVGGDSWESFGFPDRYLSSVLPVLAALVAAGIPVLLRTPKIRIFIGILAATFLALALIPLPKIDAWDIQASASPIFFAGGMLVLVAAFGRPLLIRRYSGTAVVALVVVGLAVMANGRAWNVWAYNNAEYRGGDARSALKGELIARHTDANATIVVDAIGNIAYFALDRTFVDELGKADPVIAHEEPAHLDFPPGHQKVDLAHSIGQLRPDVIASLFEPSPALRAEAERTVGNYGYVPIGSGVYVRPDTTHVDVPALTADLAANLN